MKIRKILLYNFKNFRNETVIDFSDGITFLVGPNGYGKTTIFDAIELGLTGNLSRINKVTAENIVYNKPFFQNEIGQPVIIKLWLEKMNGDQLVIVRKLVNSSTDSSNLFAPLKSASQFMLFRQVEVSETNFSSIGNTSLEEITQSSIDAFLGINEKYEIEKIFNLFNYIQQEETTFFLKRTEQERGDSLSFLVKTDKVEKKIKDINTVTNVINRKISDLEGQLKNLKQQELSDVPYHRLFNHKEFVFDVETPFSIANLDKLLTYQNTLQNIIDFKKNFSIEEYSRKTERDKRKKDITGDRAINQVLYFSMLSPNILKSNSQWLWEKYSLDNPLLFEYVLLENYLKSYESVVHDCNRRKQLNTYLTNLSADITEMTEQSITYTQNDRLSGDFELLQIQVVKFQSLRNNASQVDKNLSELRQLRSNLGNKFDELRHRHIDENKCPFCNSQFQTFEELKQAYDSYKNYLTEISSQSSLQLQEAQLLLNERIQQLKQKIIDEINSLSIDVDKNLLDRLQELKNSYQSYSQNVEGFKTFIQSYTIMVPYELGRLEFKDYNQQHQLNWQEFQSKLVVDDDVYSLLDNNSLGNIKEELEVLREEFPELQFETYQLESSSYSKINMAMIDSRLLELKNAIYSAVDNNYAINENLIADSENIFPTYFQSKVEVLEDIRIGDLENKKLYLDRQHKLVQNQQLQDLSSQIETLRITVERLEEINTIYKEEVKQFKIDIVKKLRIPFFIYSAKMLQNYQQGMGIFLTHKKTTNSDSGKVAIIRFKSDTNNDHDVMNQLSTGQLAVVSLAFTLSLNTMFKLSDNLNFLMIDDPVQDMDAMNVLSFIEILRHGIIDKYQIILSTYSDFNALFMGYKFANSNSEVNIKYEKVSDLQG
ncbi:chromosome segregation protein [Streptococcus mitis]|uniref:Nuclease SbcCD subunit C n=2 Tax=Streptococcus TaxID=1301 RepID=A0A1X1JLJ8_STRMT|nr:MULTISPECIES: SMC family ATPase [Streptococcus]MDU2139446.1 SMC family ATPase [Streptococcus mitis]MDU2761093.1 SMC family ATPase [Streptococcus mitis]ORO88034.1 recombinase RecF [Streptococcus mitis]RSI81360.1 chromosome segregation protein [Streptococcus mitis]TPD56492.1 SMC family ATPase [Streptococcus symci]